METVFVGESLIDINQWTSDNNQFQKLKIGEIFQLSDSSFSMCCLNCSQEFQYFTEFTLHIQEHFLRGEIAQLKEIKEEIPMEKYDDTAPQNEEIIITPEFKCEINQNDVDDFRWSDDDRSNDNNITDQEYKESTTEIPSKNTTIIEGTDYEKLNGKFKCLTCDHVTVQWKHLKEHLLTHSIPKEIMCPICQKLFATIAYVQKHCNRTHNMKISLDKIKEAQPIQIYKQAEVIVPSYQPLPSAAPVRQKRKPMPERKTYNEGIDYKKVGDKFQCLTCKRQMSKLDHMKEHLLTHSSEKNVLCPLCATAFITESYVRKHVNRTHNMRITADEIKAAQSSIDVSQKKKDWEIEKNQKMAQNTKTSRPTTTSAAAKGGTIQCLFCEKWFTKARYAQKHMRLIHAKPMAICDVLSCQPVTANKSEQIKSEIEIDDKNGCKEVIPVAEQDQEKNFECFECHKQFVSSNSVRIHMKLHSGIKYVCPYCNKIFAAKSYVRDHIVIIIIIRFISFLYV